MHEVKELREARMRVWEEMKKTLSDTQVSGMSAEESEKYGKMEAEYLRLTNDIDARERALEIEGRLSAPAKSPAAAAAQTATTPYVEEVRQYERAFGKWLRDSSELSREERAVLNKGRIEGRDLAVGVGSAGGYLVPEAFSNKLFEHLKWFGPMRQVAGSLTTGSGADMLYPNLDDTGNVGAILAENNAISEQDIALGSRTLKAWMYTSKLIQVSWQLMQDSAFDIDSLLSRKLGERLGRVQNTHFTTGLGGFQPEGIMTNVSTVAPATDNTLVLKDVIKLIYNVDRAYRANGILMMHDAIRLVLLQEQATTGEFVWMESPQVGEPSRLFGYPVYTNNDMDSTVADGKKVVLFGDVANGYIIREVKGISMVKLNERYADNLQTGFFAYNRCDGQPTFSSSSSVPPYKAIIL